MLSRPQLASIIFAPMGLLMVVFAIYGLWQSHQRSRWPTAQGKIEQSQVIRSEGARSGYQYRPSISYTYTVGEHVLHGDRLSLDKPGENLRSDLERRLASFPVGATVEVYYNPLNPAESVLEVGGMDWGDFGLLVFGIATLTGSILVFRLSPRTRARIH